MLPTPTITTFVLATLGAGDQSDQSSEAVVGAATMTVRIKSGRASFALASFILQPSEPTENLLAWIDTQLQDEQATLALYWPDRVVELLERLPGAELSPGVRSLKGNGAQPLIRMLIEDQEGFMSLSKACACFSIACASPDADARFAAWSGNDVGQIAADAELDAIAAWRMAINAIGRKNALGAKLATILRRHLAEWLFDTDHPYSRIRFGQPAN
ncbi:hypothetical protein BV96_01257 [Sphingomonas paucimobilis]|nr:hypothetical protein BV96_01257 [Sphingomonas paucimobilis]